VTSRSIPGKSANLRSIFTAQAEEVADQLLVNLLIRKEIAKYHRLWRSEVWQQLFKRPGSSSLLTDDPVEDTQHRRKGVGRVPSRSKITASKRHFGFVTCI
jgi:hypothetical protein